MNNRQVANRIHPPKRTGIIRRTSRWALRKLGVPAYIHLFYRASLRELAQLRADEKRTPEEVEVRQTKMLRNLISMSYGSVPYYRDSMDAAGVSPEEIHSIEDLAKLPVLTKRDIQRFANRLISSKANPKYMNPSVTSGTTGTPLSLYRDERVSPLGHAARWRMLEYVGLSPADPVLYLMLQPTHDHSARKLLLRRNLVHSVTGSRFLPLDLLMERKTEEVIKWIESVKPAVIGGYPSLLHILAQMVLQSEAALTTRPKLILYFSEQMADDTRALLEEAFHVPILSRYGAMEFSAMLAYTCPQGGWHVNSEGFIIEIADGSFGDRTGKPTGHGRIIITDLRNYVMPLIRYEIGDIGTAKTHSSQTTGPEICTCGGRGLQLGGIEGRASDYVVTPSGYQLPALLLQRTMRLQADLFWEYQFRQDTPSALEVLVIPKGDYRADLASELASTIETHLNHELQVTVKAVDSISREPSGKRPILKTRCHNIS